MRTISLATALAVFATSFASTALTPALMAQENAGDKVIQRYVYGSDDCEASTDPNEIVVCVRLEEGERYRIPENLRQDPNAINNQAWTERVRSLEIVGNSGTDSCSPAGPGGFTGCTQQLINRAYAERASNQDVQAGRLIQEAREERLARINEEAAAVEARELEIEAQLDARRAEREAAAASGVEDDADGSGDEDLTQPPIL